MKPIDLSDLFLNLVENKVLGEWKHDGFIDYQHSDGFGFATENKYYKIKIEEYPYGGENNG